MKKQVKKIVIAIIALLLIVGVLIAALAFKGLNEAQTPAEPLKEAEEVYENPLNGEIEETDFEDKRPVAVVIDNKSGTSIQGLSDADIIYETVAGDGNTQLLALYSDAESLPQVGPIGELQGYAAELAEPFSAVMVYDGSNSAGDTALSNSGLPGVDRTNETSGFAKDSQQYYTSHDLLEPILIQNGISLKEAPPKAFAFSDQAPSFEGTANEIQVAFSDTITAEFVYDSSTGCYQKNQGGKIQTDSNTGAPVNVKNVLLLYAPVTVSADGQVSVSYSQGGMGVYASGGEYSNINWMKPSEDEMFNFLNSDGDLLTLQSGNTWICILPKENRANTTIS